MDSDVLTLISDFQDSINQKKHQKCSELLALLCNDHISLKITPKKAFTYLCTICKEGFQIDKLISLECDHKFCKYDLEMYLNSKIGSKYFKIDDIKCVTCSKPIAYEIVKGAVKRQMFEIYDLALAKNYIIDNPHKPIIPHKFKCDKCNDLFFDHEIRTLGCLHVFCEKCLRQFFIKTLETEKNITKDSIFCLKCPDPIDSMIISDILPKIEREKYETLINKPFLKKPEQIQLPAIFLPEQAKEMNDYIKNKLKKKYEDFEIKGEFKERTQITLIYYDEKIFKKLKKKIKFYDRLNDQIMKNEFPADWGVFNEMARIVPMDPQSPEYLKVSAEFQKSVNNHQIVSISEIQNKPLYKKYNLVTKELIEAKKKINPNIDISGFERYLWHGTRQNDPSLIYLDEIYGFDLRHANNGSWGRGLYFGAQAAVSMGYIGYRNPNGNYILLYNKAFVGETTPGQAGLLKAPVKNAATKEFYDSTSNEQMIVIYDVWRVYPHYIVEFR